MSLFPAYQEINISRESSGSPEVKVNDKSSKSWLENSSFQAENIAAVGVTEISSDSSDCEFLETVESKEKNYPLISLDLDPDVIKSSGTLKSKKHKKKKHKQKLKVKQVYGAENIFFEDNVIDRGNLKVDTLCSRARPLYDLSEKSIGFVKNKSFKNKETIKRYFADRKREKTRKNHDGSLKRVKKTDKNDENIEEFNLNDKAVREEAKKLKIKEFNERLGEDPENVDLWLDYINFEDRDDDFESAKGGRDLETMKYQRKLAIVEKALEKNSSSKELLKKKLYFMSELVPTDQYSEQLEKMLNKDSGNIIIWQALISATRSSVSICTAPKILKLYTKCFDTLHKWPRGSQKNYDDCLLEMLHQCLLLQRHTGLWEQMWEILRLNLTFNLNISKTPHHFKSLLDEKKLIDMEEVILTSQLPLNQLWLRVELLRENCHWIGVTKEQLELVGDSHRFVSTEEIAEFVHPILSRSSNMRMAIFSFLLLKIPLLPTRHCTMKELRFEECNWAIDSIESILPMIFPCAGGEMAGHEKRINMAKGLLDAGLTSGPQYLRYHPAQEFYIDFIRDGFFHIAESLPDDDKISIYIWWLRFERMLVYIQKDSNPKCDKGFKKLKGILKDFFKREENRNNLYFYREYALIERELGKVDNCLNILKTAIEMKGTCPRDLTSLDDKKAVMSLYKSLVETLLDARTWNESTKSRVIKVFVGMSRGSSNEESLDLTEEFLYQCYRDFVSNSDDFGVDSSKVNDFFPDFYCDSVACYCYLVYVKDNNLEGIAGIFEKCLEHTRDNPQLQVNF